MVAMDAQFPIPNTAVKPPADPYHAGEQALQSRVGMRERLAEIGAAHRARSHARSAP